MMYGADWVLLTHNIENRRVRVRASEPTSSDMLVSQLRHVDAIPVDVCGRIWARARARQPT
jgi:hypothetical protein